MTDRITIGGRDGAFGAYIAQPKVLPAPAVVILSCRSASAGLPSSDIASAD